MKKKLMLASITLLLLILLPPKVAFAENFGGMLIMVFGTIYIALLVSLLSAVLIKYVMCNSLFLNTDKIPLKSFFLVMLAEGGFLAVFSYLFLYLVSVLIPDGKLEGTIAGILSYLPGDIGLVYFRKSFVEHHQGWSLIGESILFVIIASSFLLWPNYRLMRKHCSKRDNTKKIWGRSYLLSGISPTLQCLTVILLILFNQTIPDHASPEPPVIPDMKVSTLMGAAEVGNKRLIEDSIDKGADVNAGVLHYILQQRLGTSATVVRLLIEKGADVNAREEGGFTPLMIACSRIPADNEIVKLLIDSGADVNAQSDYGVTALKMSARRNQGIWVEKYGVKDTITERMLLDRGADPNIRDKAGRTALDEALQADNNGLVALLRERGAQEARGVSP